MEKERKSEKNEKYLLARVIKDLFFFSNLLSSSQFAQHCCIIHWTHIYIRLKSIIIIIITAILNISPRSDDS